MTTLALTLSRAVSVRAAFRTLPRQLSTSRILGAFCPSMPLYEKITVKVPTMGDSISDGAIVEWTADIGQVVQEGDVVAQIETDKITIDIKTESNGVITQHFGKLDDIIEVGANLYEINTEGTSTLEELPSAMRASDTMEVEPSLSTPSPIEKTSASVRIPSIKFLNKIGWMRRRKGSNLTSGTLTTISNDKSVNQNQVVTLDSSHIGPMYGRLPFSDREVEALLLGGASEAPEIVTGYS